MTNKELWRAVGEELLLHRTRRAWKPIDIQKRGGPNYGTVQDIDRGKIGRIDRVEKYADVMKLQLVDILASVLQRETAVTLTPETAQILRKYEKTTLAGRQALVATAAALPEQTPDTGVESRAVESAASEGTPPAATTVRAKKRR